MLLILTGASAGGPVGAASGTERAEAHYNAGNERQRLREFERAIVAYGEAISADPDHVPSLHQLGIVYSRVGRSSEAVRLQRLAIEKDPTFLPAHISLGQAYTAWLTDQLTRHVQTVGDPSERLDGDVRLGLLLKSIEKDGEAIDAFQHALEIDAEDGEALKELSTLYLAAGRYEECVTVSEACIELGVTSREVFSNLGEAYLRLGHPGSTVALLERFAEGNRQFVEGLVVQAKAYAQLGQLEGAIGAYRRALRVQPGKKEIRYQLAGVYQRMGDLESFEHEMTLFDLLRSGPERLPAVELAGIQRHWELNPLDGLAVHRQLAVLYAELGDAGQVEHHSNRALVWEVKAGLLQAIAAAREIEPEAAPGRQQEFQGIVDGMNRAAGYDTAAARDLVLRARRDLETEEYDEALIGFRRALVNDPENLDAHHGLIEIHLAKRFDLDRALALAQRAVDLASAAASYRLLEEVHRERGEPALAEQALRKGG